MSRSNRLVWIDLEMTGLDPQSDHIIEIATIVTESNLDLVATGPEFVIHVDDTILNSMNDWCIENHRKSGLTKRVRNSTTTLEQAESQTLTFLKHYIDENTAPLCGNSVWQDRRFLYNYMPTLNAYLHYRIIDVSTVKELATRWYPDSSDKRIPLKRSRHRAMDDIADSIAELAHYRDKIFLPK